MEGRMVESVIKMAISKLLAKCDFTFASNRDAGDGGAGGACAPQVLGYQLTLFGPRGADYARPITTCPPSFRTMRHLWSVIDVGQKINIGHGKFGNNNKRRALNKCRA